MIQPNRLRELREASKLTQKEVSKMLDIDFTTVSKHESGTRGIEPKEIEAYARLFKVSSYEIFMTPAKITNPLICPYCKLQLNSEGCQKSHP